MSHGIRYLHSHSAMERDMFVPKSKVVVDYEYRFLFGDNVVYESLTHKGKKYIIVPIALFIKNRGVFLNLKV